MFEQVLRHVSPTEKARAGQGLGESLRFVSKSTRLVPIDYSRFAFGVANKQGLKTREVPVHQALNGVTKWSIV
jgi:hypothetical protein